MSSDSSITSSDLPASAPPFLFPLPSDKSSVHPSRPILHFVHFPSSLTESRALFHNSSLSSLDDNISSLYLSFPSACKHAVRSPIKKKKKKKVPLLTSFLPPAFILHLCSSIAKLLEKTARRIFFILLLSFPLKPNPLNFAPTTPWKPRVEITSDLYVAKSQRSTLSPHLLWCIRCISSIWPGQPPLLLIHFFTQLPGHHAHWISSYPTGVCLRLSFLLFLTFQCRESEDSVLGCHLFSVDIPSLVSSLRLVALLSLSTSLPSPFLIFSLWPWIMLNNQASLLSSTTLLSFFLLGVGMGRIWLVGEGRMLCSFSHW